MLAVVSSAMKSRAALQVENIALRHQIGVLQRSAKKRLPLNNADRPLWIGLSRAWTEWRSALKILKPDTVIGWHRKAFRMFWTWKVRRGRPGRPAVSAEIRALIRRMSRENSGWGAPRIHGELLKLGIDIGETSVSKYLVRSGKPPSQTWRTFLANHLQSLVSVDFFTVPTIRFQVLYVFLVLAHERRRICSLRRDRTSDSGVDGSSTSGGLSMGELRALSERKLAQAVLAAGLVSWTGLTAAALVTTPKVTPPALALPSTRDWTRLGPTLTRGRWRL